MAGSSFGAYIELDPSSLGAASFDFATAPVAPKKAVPHNYHSVLQEPPDNIELDNLQWGAKLTGPAGSGHAIASVVDTPNAPNDLEMSRPTTPVPESESFDAMQSFSNPPMNRFRMLSVCLMTFGQGLNDSAPGALIPYIETNYNIGYAVVSLIFVTNAVGFILAAFSVDVMRARLGRGRTMMLANGMLAAAFLAIVCTPPFPVVVASFFLLGLGFASNLALGNVFTGSLQNSTQWFGIAHGCYGIGGTLGPLVATAMITSGGLVWSRFYILTLAIAVFNIGFTGWSFWYYEKESLPSRDSISITRLSYSRERNLRSATTDHEAVRMAQSVVKPTGQFSSMAKAIKNKVVLLGALFIFAYQGAEVSISGWVISFLLTFRNGNPASVGYVTVGFWGGITLGRFLLTQPAHKIGEKKFVYGVVVGAVAFQLLVWFVPNIIGDAVAVAIVGLLLGPVYPCAIAVFARTIPGALQVSGFGVLSAFGSSGGAVAPFTTGILAQAVGTFVLHPIAIGLFVVMLGSWYGIPNIGKRRE